jgi:glycosyltransferase involved in cell wall biosynthesis
MELVENYFGERRKPKEIIFNGSTVTKDSTDSLLERRQSNERKKIICSSNWRPNKRLDAIIETVINVRKDIDCELIIIGKINQEIPDEEFIKPMGYINNDDLNSLLKDCNAFMHLCLLDNCPNSVIEAIANRLPVISSNLGGTKELIESTSSGVVSECDQEIDFSNLVDQQNPPKPSIQKLSEDLVTLFQNEETITQQINTQPIDIKTTAKSYVDFATKVAKGYHAS